MKLVNGWPHFEKNDFGYDGRHLTFATPAVYQALKRVYSDVDVDYELRQLEIWLTSHPPKRDWKRFVCNNLLRAKKRQSVPNTRTIEQPGVDRDGPARQEPRSIGDLLADFTRRGVAAQNAVDRITGRAQ